MKSQRDGHRRIGGDICQRFGVFAEHRLLDKHRQVGLQRADQRLRHGPCNASVKINPNADVAAHGLPYGCKVGHGRVDLRVRIDVIHLFAAVHFHSAKSSRNHLACALCNIRGTVAADPRVHLNAVTNGTAQQLVHRNAERFALDVP